MVFSTNMCHANYLFLIFTTDGQRGADIVRIAPLPEIEIWQNTPPEVRSKDPPNVAWILSEHLNFC